ncbi:hypothetical protein AFK68_24285 [Hydrocoleum sp. CS-953]|uniref:hypothetical protein n=1 Tax=Hydrocoleum sp. CS-953 TaxID=1671698 RepID=UPI000B9BDA21|nr:hypothetical protein [Hydrocoleum sp. CS-953]OZH52456.1 hypothetical protein AFK68_24285 [Hydrocoleum sp. CS-953]
MKQQESKNQEDVISKILSLSKILSYGTIVILCSYWRVSYSAQAQLLSQEDQTTQETSTLPKLTEPLPKGIEAQPPLLPPPPEPILIPEPEKVMEQ